MTIPTSSNYPDTFDSDENLYGVHDSLRVSLIEDYNPGDTRIFISGDPEILDRFPATGLLTLTEQCSDVDKRAISFYYSSKTVATFEGLELLPGFEDVAKPKNVTNVTQNVMSAHHNNIKDAIIAIENFIGIKGTTDLRPLGSTLEGRINFLTKLILTPKAWFSVDKTIGLVPLEVTFNNESFRIGCSDVVYTWSFGDQTISNISIDAMPTIEAISVVPNISNTDLAVIDLDGGIIKKTYNKPGLYDVILKVKNNYGEDIVTFRNLINARIKAPDVAVIDVLPRSGQVLTSGDPIGGPYTTPPKLRVLANTFIDLQVASGENPATPGISYGGELLDGGGNPIDPVIIYNWILGDDLEHINSSSARAAYSTGGFFDLVLRVDTSFGTYRITTYEDAFDVIESTNLWLWNFDSSNTGVIGNEFGILSETFKSASTSLTITRDDSFLDGSNNEEQAKREFSRNVAFAPRNSTASGSQGEALMYWASGGPSLATQFVNVRTYNGFLDTYSTQTSVANRPWNWLHLSSGRDSYFLFGQDPTATTPNSNPSYQVKTTHNLASLTSSNLTLQGTNYKNGALDLVEHESQYDEDGNSIYGYFAVYRTAWKNQNGYILRNEGVGPFFRVKNFYKTEGTVGNIFQNITKMPDMAGPAKLEGQLVPLTNGVFFFNNTGSISAFNDTSSTWETGGASLSSVAFRSLQDASVSGFDNPANTLLAASNGDRLVYLSYDYSPNSFIKFNGADQTFSSAGSRPAGDQFLMGIY